MKKSGAHGAHERESFGHAVAEHGATHYVAHKAGQAVAGHIGGAAAGAAVGLFHTAPLNPGEDRMLAKDFARRNNPELARHVDKTVDNAIRDHLALPRK